MSIAVQLPNLADTLARYRFAYLLTSSTQGAPRAVAVRAALHDGVLLIDDVGQRTRANAQQRPEVGLVWPPQNEGAYSLIVDGHATVVGEQMQVRPSRAVLHRPAVMAQATGAAQAPDAAQCAADCVPLALPGGQVRADQPKGTA